MGLIEQAETNRRAMQNAQSGRDDILLFRQRLRESKQFHGKHDQKTHGRRKSGPSLGGGRTVTRDEALKELDKLPVVQEGKQFTWVSHPIPIASTYVREGVKIEDGQIVRAPRPTKEQVKVSKLRRRKGPEAQRVVQKQNVQYQINSRNNKPIKVVKVKDEFIIWDGHHRSTAAILTGMDTINAQVWQGIAVDQ